MSDNIIKLRGSTTQPDAAFYNRLEIPVGVAEWIKSWGSAYEFQVIADPVTGRLAGIIRSDLVIPISTGSDKLN